MKLSYKSIFSLLTNAHRVDKVGKDGISYTLYATPAVDYQTYQTYTYAGESYILTKPFISATKVAKEWIFCIKNFTYYGSDLKLNIIVKISEPRAIIDPLTNVDLDVYATRSDNSNFLFFLPLCRDIPTIFNNTVAVVKSIFDRSLKVSDSSIYTLVTNEEDGKTYINITEAIFTINLSNMVNESPLSDDDVRDVFRLSLLTGGQNLALIDEICKTKLASNGPPTKFKDDIYDKLANIGDDEVFTMELHPCSDWIML